MIVDLNLRGRTVVVVGGGAEAQKRVQSLLGQGCKILVISQAINPQIGRLVRAKKIEFKKQKIADAKFIAEFKPDMVITTTDDAGLNQKIVSSAKRRGIMAYSSDSPEESDFSNPSVIDFGSTVQVAVFTGGRSPAMSKKIKAKAERALKKVITRQDIAQIRVQEIARKLAREAISGQTQRRDALRAIMNDSEIDQLIKDGKIKKAERRAVSIVRGWE